MRIYLLFSTEYCPAMMISQIDEKKVFSQFLQTLGELPGIRFQRGVSGGRAGTAPGENNQQVEAIIDGKSLKLVVEIKKVAYPRDVRELLWRFKSLLPDTMRKNDRFEDFLPVLVAESISPGGKELLRENRIAYYESGGSLYLQAPEIYIYVDKPGATPLARSIRSIFAGRRAQVLQALLLRAQDWFDVGSLAERANVSPATVSQTVLELERLEWAESRGRGPAKKRRLLAPGPLLDAWANQYSAAPGPALRRFYVPSGGAESLIGKVAHEFEAHGVEYAVTHEAAAQQYSPYLSNISQVRCWAPAPKSCENVIAALNARAVKEGANLVLMEAEPHSAALLFKQRWGEVWLASPIQVYLDLMGGEGRSKEMAAHLRRDNIGL